MKVVRIYPKFGIRNLLPSDTLWGNLLFAIKRLYGVGTFKEILNKFLENSPPFIVSSCFPFDVETDNNIVYYFPIPFIPSNSPEVLVMTESVEEMIYYKEFKKIKLIEKDYFEKIINGSLDEKELFKNFVMWRKNPEDVSIFKSVSPPKVSYTLHNKIDRWNSKTYESDDGGALFWEEEYVFESGKKGLFFLVEGDLSYLLPALRFLSDVGIAGHNSIGKGKFSFEIEDFNLSLPGDPNSQVTLSLFTPSQEDLLELNKIENRFWYELKLRKGHTGVDFDVEAQEKNAVLVFGEGSTFMTEKKLKGKLIRTGLLKEDYPVYNYYLGFTIPSYFKV